MKEQFLIVKIFDLSLKRLFLKKKMICSLFYKYLFKILEYTFKITRVTDLQAPSQPDTAFNEPPAVSSTNFKIRLGSYLRKNSLILTGVVYLFEKWAIWRWATIHEKRISLTIGELMVSLLLQELECFWHDIHREGTEPDNRTIKRRVYQGGSECFVNDFTKREAYFSMVYLFTKSLSML